MSEPALASLLVPGLLAVIAGQLGFGFRSLKAAVVRHGEELKLIKWAHLKRHPEDFDDLKIGGSR